MHSVVDAAELSETLRDLVRSSSSLTTEADVRYIQRDQFLRAITLPEGDSLRDRLDEAQWEAVIDALDGVLRPDELDRLQPWYVEGALTRSLLPAVETIDVDLVESAAEAGVELDFLEAWLGQVQMLNALGLEHGVALLLGTVADLDAVVEANNAWAAAYRGGDLELLEGLAFDPSLVASRPEFYEQIVYDRNDRWLSSIEERLEEGDAVVAVGFMHLMTDRGIPRLLEQRGYSVTRRER